MFLAFVLITSFLGYGALGSATAYLMGRCEEYWSDEGKAFAIIFSPIGFWIAFGVLLNEYGEKKRKEFKKEKDFQDSIKEMERVAELEARKQNLEELKKLQSGGDK